VVEFQSSAKRKRQICIVPVEWLIDDCKCTWPTYRKQKEIYAAVKSRQKPEDNWEVFSVRILGSAGLHATSFCMVLLVFV